MPPAELFDGEKETLAEWEWRNRLRPEFDSGLHLSKHQLKRLWIRALISLRERLITRAKVMFPKHRDYRALIVKLGTEVQVIDIADGSLDDDGNIKENSTLSKPSIAHLERQIALLGGRGATVAVVKNFALKKESERYFSNACRAYLDAKNGGLIEFSRGTMVGRPKGVWPLAYLSRADYWLGVSYMQFSVHSAFGRTGGNAKDKKVTAPERESTIVILRALIANDPKASANKIASKAVTKPGVHREYDTLRRWASQIKKGQEPTSKR